MSPTKLGDMRINRIRRAIAARGIDQPASGIKISDGVVMLAVDDMGVSPEILDIIDGSDKREAWEPFDLFSFSQCMKPNHDILYQWLTSKTRYQIEVGFWQGTANTYVRILFDDPKDAKLFAFQAELIR